MSAIRNKHLLLLCFFIGMGGVFSQTDSELAFVERQVEKCEKIDSLVQVFEITGVKSAKNVIELLGKSMLNNDEDYRKLINENLPDEFDLDTNRLCKKVIKIKKRIEDENTRNLSIACEVTRFLHNDFKKNYKNHFSKTNPIAFRFYKKLDEREQELSEWEGLIGCVLISLLSWVLTSILYSHIFRLLNNSDAIIDQSVWWEYIVLLPYEKIKRIVANEDKILNRANIDKLFRWIRSATLVLAYYAKQTYEGIVRRIEGLNLKFNAAENRTVYHSGNKTTFYKNMETPNQYSGVQDLSKQVDKLVEKKVNTRLAQLREEIAEDFEDLSKKFDNALFIKFQKLKKGQSDHLIKTKDEIKEQLREEFKNTQDSDIVKRAVKDELVYSRTEWNNKFQKLKDSLEKKLKELFSEKHGKAPGNEQGIKELKNAASAQANEVNDLKAQLDNQQSAFEDLQTKFTAWVEKTQNKEAEKSRVEKSANKEDTEKLGMAIDKIAELQALVTQLTDVGNELKETTINQSEQIEKLQKQISEKQPKNEELQKQLYDQIAEISKKNEQLQGRLGEVSKKVQELGTDKNQVEGLTKELEAIKDLKLVEQLAALKSVEDQLKNLITSNKWEQQIATVEQKTISQSKQIEELNSQLESKEANYSELKVNIKKATDDLASVEVKINDLLPLKEKEQKIDAIEKLAESQAKQVEELNTQFNLINTNYPNLQKQLNEITKNTSTLKPDKEQFDLFLNDIKEMELKKLKEELTEKISEINESIEGRLKNIEANEEKNITANGQDVEKMLEEKVQPYIDQIGELQKQLATQVTENRKLQKQIEDLTKAQKFVLDRKEIEDIIAEYKSSKEAEINKRIELMEKAAKSTSAAPPANNEAVEKDLQNRMDEHEANLNRHVNERFDKLEKQIRAVPSEDRLVSIIGDQVRDIEDTNLGLLKNFEKRIEEKLRDLGSGTVPQNTTSVAAASEDTWESNREEAPIRADLFYSPAPQEERFYGRKLRKTFAQKETMYRITISPTDPDKGEYTLVQDPDTIRYALNIPSDYLLAAWELEGKGKINEASNIEIKAPGEIAKDGNNWKITKKGIVKYY